MNLPLSLARLSTHVPEAAVAPGDAALARVLSLPRREPASPELVEELSRYLRVRGSDDVCPAGPGTPEDPCLRCGGTGRIMLRPAQVEALREVWEYGCLFAALGVGAGKSLLGFLIATLLGSLRPVLLIPKKLEGKTKREFAGYARDWKVRLPALVSYQLLGNPKRERLLLDGDRKLGIPAEPDLLIADECQALFNTDVAVTRRWLRCIERCRPIAVPMSGTLFGANLMRYHHIAAAVMGDRAPMPVRPAEAERWAQALDRELGVLHRIAPGELESIPGGYHKWFRESRGVLVLQSPDCNASIEFSLWQPDVPPALRQIIEDVALSSLRPDDELLDELELPECLSQLALGFYYRWDPPPPSWWLDPRRAWYRYVRDVIEAKLEGFDSTAPVVAALDYPGGLEPPDAIRGRALLAAWREVRDQFEPNSVPVWIDVSVLVQAAEHARKQGTLVWVRFTEAGEMLAKLGIPYYGGGTEPDSDAPPGQPIALSIQAHATGRNMQAWDRSLVLTPPANADGWEQLIGRTHRAGQKSDTVLVECISTIDYHAATLSRVLAQARADSKAADIKHKLVLADWT